jgi:hemoglobin
MDQAMTELRVDPALRERLGASFFKTADWMHNQAV